MLCLRFPVSQLCEFLHAWQQTTGIDKAEVGGSKLLHAPSKIFTRPPYLPAQLSSVSLENKRIVEPSPDILPDPSRNKLLATPMLRTVILKALHKRCSVCKPPAYFNSGSELMPFLSPANAQINGVQSPETNSPCKKFLVTSCFHCQCLQEAVDFSNLVYPCTLMLSTFLSLTLRLYCLGPWIE